MVTYEDRLDSDAYEDLLEIRQGRTYKEYFAIDLPDGSVVNPAASETEIVYAALSVRDKHDGTELVSLTSDNGGIFLQLIEEPDENGDPSGIFWSGYWYMSHAATSTLVPWGLGVWDMYVQYSNGEKDTLYSGQAVLIKRVAV